MPLIYGIAGPSPGRLGDGVAAAHAVVESERAFERTVAENEPLWAQFMDDANLSCHWADTFVTLHQPTEASRFAKRAISAAASQNRARRGTFSHAALARAALDRRDLDGALRAAHRVADLSTTVRSSRCTAAVRDLQTRIRPYRKVTAAREFDDRAREALTQAT